MRIHRGVKNIYHISGLIEVTQTLLLDVPYGISFDGADYTSCADDASQEIGSNDFTFECWYKSNASPTTWEVAIRKVGSYYLQWYNDGGSKYMLLGKVVGGAEKLWGTSTPPDLWDGAWHHIAGVHDLSAGTGVLYADGTAQTNNAWDASDTTAPDDGGILYIGGLADAYGVKGVLDEVRVSNMARYTENFTAPTSRFTNDDNTIVLYHMQENTGTTTADDSGNGNTQTFASGASAPAWADGKFA